MEISPYLAGLVSIATAKTIDSTVSIASGTLQGRLRNNAGIISFLGSPFADPPVGDLRWKSPQAVTKWNETLDVT
jgi:carboxylesterase type B